MQDPTLGTDATGGERARQCELDGTRGGDQSFEVLKRGGLHLVVTEVVPVGDGADKKEKEKKKERGLATYYLATYLQFIV